MLQGKKGLKSVLEMLHLARAETMIQIAAIMTIIKSSVNTNSLGVPLTIISYRHKQQKMMKQELTYNIIVLSKVS